MHKFDCEERVVVDRGVLCREITALGIGRLKGNRLVVAKIYEDGRQICRNIECRPIAGWCIEWPGEIYREEYGYGCHEAEEQPFKEPYGDISGCSWKIPGTSDKESYIRQYPEFKWVLAKSELSNQAYFHILPYWKKHPHEIEMLLSAGYKKLALDGRLWNAGKKKQRQILEWLRANRADIDNPHLDGIRCCIKYECTYGQWSEYYAATTRDTRVDYDIYRWLKDKLKGNRSLYSELRQYMDYAKMAKEAGHDIRDRYWRFPKSLKRSHDKVMAEVENIRAAKKAEELRKRGLQYIEAVKKWIGKEIVPSKGWRVYVPDSAEDIVHQAEALKQCLVSADYIGRCINGQCVLVFVRYRNRPIATAEILPGGKLGQFYGNEANRSRCSPTKAAKEAMAAWQAKFLKIKKTKAIKEAA